MQASIERSIIKVIAYFDLFNYPISKEEIHFFLDRPAPEKEVQAVLYELLKAGIIFRLDNFYSLQNDPSLARRRVKGNAHASSLLITAYRVSRILFRFPFVRGIGISGSLSKKFADEHADIDFFIVTKTSRLWIARTLMHLFKKLTFLVGKQHWFCMNYYIDEEAMQIEEHNIFTATELITLIPVYGNGTMDKFFKANNWAVYYYPNYVNKKNEQQPLLPKSTIKKFSEWLLNNRFGDRLDNYLMKVTTKRWKKKEAKGKLNMRGIKMGLRTGKHFSKPNPSFFQERIIEHYNRKLQDLESRWSRLNLPA